MAAPTRPAGALIVATLIVALAACTGPNVPPTPTPAVPQSPVIPATRGPSTVDPIDTSVPTPSQTPTPSPHDGWLPLAEAPDAGAVWSPDAAHVLAWTAMPGGPPETNVVELMTRHGEPVHEFDAVTDPVWLDASRFVVYRLDWQQDDNGDWYAETGPNGERLGLALSGDVGSDELREIDLSLEPALSNGRSTLALSRFDASGTAEFALWRDRLVAPWRDGRPLAWSAFGGRLLILHSDELGPGAEGWLEVVESDGTSVWSSDSDVRVSSAEFDSSGDFLAYPVYVARPRQPRQVPEFDLVINVVELGTGTVSSFPAQENGMFTWWGEGELIVVGFESSVATNYDRAGNVLASEQVIGPNVSTAADGSAALFYDAELDAPELQILREGTLRLLGSPGNMTGPPPRLAPDGSGLLVVVRLPSSGPPGRPAAVLLHQL